MLTLGLVALISFSLGFGLRTWIVRRKFSFELNKATDAEAQFRLMVESVKDYAIFKLDPSGRIMTWNKGARALKGYEQSEIIGSHFSRFYRDESKASGLCEFELQEASETGRFEGEGWRIRKDGSEFWANVVISAIRNSDGELLGFTKVTRDLTERRRAEEDLRKREVLLKEAQRIANVGSWEWDVKNNTITWSDEMFTIFDIQKENFDPSFEGYLERLDPARRANIEKLIQDAMTTGRDFAFEHTVKQRNGSVKYVQGRGRVILDENGKPLKMTGTAQDITDRKKIEEELIAHQADLESHVRERTAELHEALEREKQAKKAAQAATQAKMQFLANMSHEIRTPMNAILGFTELLNGDNLNADQKDFLARVQANGIQLLQIIDDILDLSKFEAGKVPLNKEDFSLSDLLEEAVASIAPLADKKGLSVDIVKSPMTPAMIYSDSMRVKQILNNLLSNAIKFSDKGRIRVSTDVVSGRQDRSLLSISVEDSGIGISPENQRKLFQPFMQADGSIARKFGGTGLGLTLSRHIAQALGGDLVLKSSVPGMGSCFQFTMALEKIASTAPESLSAPVVRIAPPTPSLDDLKLSRTVHILLAEDSPENDFLVRRYLKHDEIQIDSARNGFEALDLASKKNYDLVLMDLQMPELDGLEATRRLREQGFKNPIIAWTAHAFREDKERSLSAGCSGYLSKPVNRGELVKMIKNSLERH
jgi:PAS domain S-box-containing protein